LAVIFIPWSETKRNPILEKDFQISQPFQDWFWTKQGRVKPVRPCGMQFSQSPNFKRKPPMAQRWMELWF